MGSLRGWTNCNCLSDGWLWKDTLLGSLAGTSPSRSWVQTWHGLKRCLRALLVRGEQGPRAFCLQKAKGVYWEGRSDPWQASWGGSLLGMGALHSAWRRASRGPGEIASKEQESFITLPMRFCWLCYGRWMLDILVFYLEISSKGERR